MDRKQFWILPGVVGLIFIVLGLGIAASERSLAIMLDTRIDAAQIHIQTAFSRIEEAEGEYQRQHLKYADHWSAGIDVPLTQARETLGPEGLTQQSLIEARRAIKNKKWADSEILVSQAEEKAKVSTETIDKILGPPETTGQGLYDQLEVKSQQALNKVELAKTTIANNRKKLDDKLADSWNRDHGVELKAAYAKLVDAQLVLGFAQIALTERVERGLVDLPQAHDEALMAVGLANDALQLASDEETLARSTWQAIETCQLVRRQSNVYILASSYRQSEALAQLLITESTLQQALSAFDAKNYTSAKSLADNCFVQAMSAQGVAATPTPIPPTPIPPPTTDWSSYSSNDNTSGGWSNPGWSSNPGGSIFNDSPGGLDLGGSDPGGWSSPDFGGSDSGSWSDSDW